MVTNFNMGVFFGGLFSYLRFYMNLNPKYLRYQLRDRSVFIVFKLIILL